MLESLRRSGASIFVYLIFGLLIVIFVINFAPSRKNGEEGGGCRGTSNVVISVDGADANQTSYKIAYSYVQQSQYLAERIKGRNRVYYALEMLIRRELLATAAAEHGLRVSGELTDEQIKLGNFFIGGQRVPLGEAIFDVVDKDRFFNIKKYKGWVNSLNVSPGSYRDEQSRGLQAEMMSELIQRSVRVSRDEALAEFLYDHNTVTYDLAVFSPADYVQAMRLTDADVQRFLTTHEDEVKARFKIKTYKGVKPQLKLRSIFIATAAPAAAPTPPAPAPTDDKKPDGAKPDDGKPGAADATPVKPDLKAAAKPSDKKVADAGAGKPAMSVDEAKTKLEEARATIANGKKKFAEFASVLATDETMRANGGDLGWRTADNAQLDEAPVNDAVKTLKAGDMTPVIATEHGVYLLIAEDKREGDLTYDQVKLEIARDLAKDVWSKEAAKRAALATLASTKASGKTLDQLFEHETPKPKANSIEDMLNDPTMPPEQKQKIIEMLKKQLPPQHGSLEVESKDIPAAWYADPDDTGGAASPTPALGSGAGAGSGSATTAPVVPPAPPPPVDVVASKDELPVFGEVSKPKVSREGPTPRIPSLPGLGTSKGAAAALFDELGVGDLAKKVYEADGNFVLVQLISKAEPKVEDFEKEADHKIDELQQARAQSTLEEWLKTRCEALAKAGKIKPSAELIRESDDKGNPAPTVYHPCMSFH